MVCSSARLNPLTWAATCAINRQEPAITITGPKTATNRAAVVGEAGHNNANPTTAPIGPMNFLTRRIHGGPDPSSQTTCADRLAMMDPMINTVIPEPTAAAAGSAARSRPGHPVASNRQTAPAISAIPTQLVCGSSG